MEPPLCKLCGERHWRMCPKFAGTSKDDKRKAVGAAVRSVTIRPRKKRAKGK